MGMKLRLMVCGMGFFLASSGSVWAQHTKAELKEDIARHRAMATAHGKAAQCLEAGKDAKVCMVELQAACKDLAIGRYCGMKHAH